MSALALYDTAREALATALRIDEVMDVRDTAERIRLYGKQAKDRRIIADASALQLRAERRLGQLLISAKETGELGIGRPGHSNLGHENGSEAEPFSEEVERVTLKAAGIDKKLSMNAQRWAKLGDAEFEDKLQAVRDKIESGGAVVVNPLKDLSTTEKKSRRAEREAALGKKQMALPEAKFGVILADPEWLFAVRSEGGMDRAADNHYPTSALEAIKARDVGSLAADDAALFLWATVPGLAQALEVMAAWGFTYKSNFEWRKDRIGTGYWNRNRHEHLLIGTRGNVPAPAMGEQFESSIEAPVGAHSAKPEKFYEIIEAYFPTLPKIELNARTARAGWARWGYEAPEETTAERAPVEPAETQAGDGNGLRSKGNATLAQPGVGVRDNGALAVALGTSQREDGASPAPPSPDFDQIIRDAYAAGGSGLIARLEAATGLTANQIKGRARRMNLSDRNRQREAVAAANKARTAVGGAS